MSLHLALENIPGFMCKKSIHFIYFIYLHFSPLPVTESTRTLFYFKVVSRDFVATGQDKEFSSAAQ